MHLSSSPPLTARSYKLPDVSANRLHDLRTPPLGRERVDDGSVSMSRETQECAIVIKYVLSAGLVIGLALPAFAAEYFIVRGPDKQCRVVEKRPTEKTIVVVGDRAYVTKEEATKQVAVVCKER